MGRAGSPCPPDPVMPKEGAKDAQRPSRSGSSPLRMDPVEAGNDGHPQYSPRRPFHSSGKGSPWSSRLQGGTPLSEGGECLRALHSPNAALPSCPSRPVHQIPRRTKILDIFSLFTAILPLMNDRRFPPRSRRMSAPARGAPDCSVPSACRRRPRRRLRKGQPGARRTGHKLEMRPRVHLFWKQENS